MPQLCKHFTALINIPLKGNGLKTHTSLEMEIFSNLPLHSFYYLGATLLLLILMALSASERIT